MTASVGKLATWTHSYLEFFHSSTCTTPFPKSFFFKVMSVQLFISQVVSIESLATTTKTFCTQNLFPNKPYHYFIVLNTVLKFHQMFRSYVVDWLLQAKAF
jgi:hypothetical protein